MPLLKIDDNKFEVEKGKTVLEVALENDIDIINERFSTFFKQAIKVYFKVESDNKKNNNKDKQEQHPLLSKAIDLLDGEII